MCVKSLDFFDAASNYPSVGASQQQTKNKIDLSSTKLHGLNKHRLNNRICDSEID